MQHILVFAASAWAVARPPLASMPAVSAIGHSCVTPHVMSKHVAGRAAVARMQVNIDSQAATFYDEYQRTNAETGDREPITFAAKEQLYLECLDAYYNEGEALLGDEEYSALKLDLDFEGSTLATLSKDEVKYILANKRFNMGKPILSDSEYDALRNTLKAAGSPVVLHEAPSCSLDTGICKMDLRVDQAKQRLLYFPGTVGSLIILCELQFWTLHLDPLLSILLGAAPSYFFGKYFTENIFSQQPLVATGACPECNYLLTTYFGDLFNVQTDGMVGGPTPISSQVDVKCPNCKMPLLADRDKMIIQTTIPKN